MDEPENKWLQFWRHFSKGSLMSLVSLLWPRSSPAGSVIYHCWVHCILLRSTNTILHTQKRTHTCSLTCSTIMTVCFRIYSFFYYSLVIFNVNFPFGFYLLQTYWVVLSNISNNGQALQPVASVDARCEDFLSFLVKVVIHIHTGVSLPTHLFSIKLFFISYPIL